MIKSIFPAILGAAIILPNMANAADKFADQYFSNQDITLTAQEREAIKLAKSWASGKAGIGPSKGSDGSIKFVFGAEQPSIVCAVLQVCDVALQPGESVNNIHLGDKVRWTVEPAITGSGSSETTHLIIKPLDVGLDTSLVVTTSHRTYHMKLRSTRNDYMQSVSFAYPKEALAKWDQLRERNARKQHEFRKNNTLQETNEYLGDLDFEYQISGDAPWKPVRVYNNGRKTIIEMPKEIQSSESPTLLVVDYEGGLFSDEETSMVNYRVQNNRYIIDRVFHKGILISGVGDRQERITITQEQ